MTNSISLLEAKNITKIYDKRKVVEGLSLKFQGGEIAGLLGRNGAGKTTTFQILVGLIKPDEGSIFLNGQDITRMPSPKRALSGLIYLPQENSIFLRATVEDNLRLILGLQPLSRNKKKQRLEELLEQFNLTELRRQGSHTLSGGEQRKLEIARALILNPRFLFLDEPFTGVDPLTIVELKQIIINLKKTGIGLVISDHNVHDTFAICDHVHIIDEGKILVSGPPAEVAVNNLAKERFLGPDFLFAAAN
ncbi:MAG: LPS export ABC transporter ATP-binding protein [Candidatus Aminicenantales bacterium]